MAATQGRKRLDRILVTTDLSSLAAPAVDEAVAICRDYGSSELILLHVVDMAGHRYPGAADEVAEEREELESLAGRLRGGLPNTEVKPIVRIGEPSEAITRMAEKEGVDLIVIATHGRSGITRAILGSVTSDVLARTPCPVLVVRSSPKSES